MTRNGSLDGLGGSDRGPGGVGGTLVPSGPSPWSPDRPRAGGWSQPGGLEEVRHGVLVLRPIEALPELLQLQRVPRLEFLPVRQEETHARPDEAALDGELPVHVGQRLVLGPLRPTYDPRVLSRLRVCVPRWVGSRRRPGRE